MTLRLQLPKSTNGLMLDTNIFGWLLANPNSISDLNTLGKPLCITHVQADEINDTKDPKIKQLLQQQLNVVDLEDNLSTFGFVLDVSRLDNAYLTDGTELDQVIASLDAKTGQKVLKAKPANNPKDALIAITAHENNFTLLTNDKRLFDTARQFGFSVLLWRNIV